MKRCSKCNISRPFVEFSRDKKRPDGLTPWCVKCQADYRKQPHVLLRNKVLKAAKYAENREAISEKRRAEYAADGTAARARSIARRKSKRISAQEFRRAADEHASHVMAYREWKAKNKRERAAQRASDWYKANTDRALAACIEYRKANRGAKNAAAMRYIASKYRATPAWADREKIKSYYVSCDGLRMLTGEWYEVDHIVPLRGRTVCGLHNEFNLQILTARENASKNNRYWPNMPV